MGKLDGKVAFITGAGAGIAKAAALTFAREGARVAIIELNAEAGAQTEAAVAAQGGRACLFRRMSPTPRRCRRRSSAR